METRYWLGVVAVTIVLAVAKLFGTDVSWLVVLAPIWAPPILFFLFAAVSTFIAALAMGGRTKDSHANGGTSRNSLTAYDRLKGWVNSKRHTGTGIVVAVSAHGIDVTQATTRLLS